MGRVLSRRNERREGREAQASLVVSAQAGGEVRVDQQVGDGIAEGRPSSAMVAQVQVVTDDVLQQSHVRVNTSTLGISPGAATMLFSTLLTLKNRSGVAQMKFKPTCTQANREALPRGILASSGGKLLHVCTHMCIMTQRVHDAP
jgi:hypothetical protein